MIIRIGVVLAVFVLLFSSILNAEEKNDKGETVIDPKQIKLKVKKLKRTRKIKSKEEFPRTEGGIDYTHDDKTDSVSITVNIQNKNTSSLKNYKIVAVVYGKSVTDKKAAPDVHTEFEEPIKDLKSRGNFKKEFTCEMVYDKSDDIYEEDKEDKNGDKVLNAFTQEPEKLKKMTPAFGISFYGFKVDVVNAEGEVLVSYVWPGGLKKMLEKAEKQKQKLNLNLNNK